MLFDFSQPNKFLQKNGFSSIPAVLAESEVVRWLASSFPRNIHITRILKQHITGKF